MTETSEQTNIRMLNIYVCLNSQHSKWRIKAQYEKFENLDRYKIISFYVPKRIKIFRYVARFYGNQLKMSTKVKIPPKFDEIPLNEFFNVTAPELVVLRVNFPIDS